MDNKVFSPRKREYPRVPMGDRPECNGFKVHVDMFGREVFEACVGEGYTVRDLLTQLGLRASEVVVAVDGEVVTEDEPLKPGSRVKIHSVVSGG